MDKITRVPAARVGVDLSKRVIQVQAVDGAGRGLTNRALSRDKFVPWCSQLPPGGLVVMEVSSSAHHWARKLLALGWMRASVRPRRAIERAFTCLEHVRPVL